MSNLKIRRLVVIGAALAAVAVLAVAVTLLATGDGGQPERERSVTATSSETTLGTENNCTLTLERLVLRDQVGDLELSRTMTRSTPSCILPAGTALVLPTVTVFGETTAQLSDDWPLIQ